MTTAAQTADQTRGRVRAERAAKRVRAYLGGDLVVDTIRPLLVWEVPHYPAYYFDPDDVLAQLVEDGNEAHSPSRGDAQLLTVKTKTRKAPGAALRYDSSPLREIEGLIRLDWDAMDAWFEEDEQVFTHPHDPYTRIDILHSSRHVRVELDGVTVAESSKPTLLFETGLPARYYLPKTDVRMDRLIPTDTVSHCAYKGQAEYWSVRTGEGVRDDLVWSYRTPLPEAQKIAGLVSFYNEKVDIYVDGVLQERPVTKFS
jgi:uncharacterized protein (DUF427 family)